MKLTRIAVAFGATMLVASCAGTTTGTDPVSAPPPSSSSVPALAPAPEVAPDPVSVPIPVRDSAPRVSTAVAVPKVEEPYIVDCQTGVDPVATYWSTGAVTGVSDFCQAQYDVALAEATSTQSPACDGYLCELNQGLTEISINMLPAPPRPPTTTPQPAPECEPSVDDAQPCAGSAGS